MHVGLGPHFSRWVKILYQEPNATVITNGTMEGDQRVQSGLFSESITVHNVLGLVSGDQDE